VKIELTSRLPSHTMLQRLAERIAPSSDSGRALSSAANAALGGRIAGNAFQIAVKPTGRWPHVVVGRGIVTPTTDGCVVRARLARAFGFYTLFLFSAVFCVVGAARFVRAAREGQLSFWGGWFDSLGMFFVGILFILILVGSYFDERETIIGVLRDAAAAT
jgi:hypothetical protein